MDELWLRLGILIVAIGIAAAVSIRMVTGAARRPRPISDAPLPDGVYLFTSSTCADCDAARSALTESLGAEGFTEMKWEAEPWVFDQLQVESVPSTLVVAGEGGSILYPGHPARALASLQD